MSQKIKWIDRTYSRLTIVGIIIVILFGWLWLHFFLMSPSQVFWGMIDNNLAVNSVVRSSTQTTNAGSLSQTTQLQFGAQNIAHALITLTQKDQSGSTVVKTETIGTPTEDYSRYVNITTNQKNSQGKNLDFSKVINVWGKSATSSGNQNNSSQYLSQAAFGIVPFSNLSYPKRSQLIAQLKQKQVYSVNYDSLSTQRVAGHTVYAFKVTLQPKPYVEFLQLLAKTEGLPPLAGLDPTAYANSQPVQLTLNVDKLSRQLIRVQYDASNQQEDYSGYGLISNVSLPKNTIPFTTLQKRLQAVQ